MNREIYRRARESSVRGAYSRLEEILSAEGRSLVAIILLAIGAGLAASWLISRGLARPVRELTRAMAVVGSGRGRASDRHHVPRRDRRPRPRLRAHDGRASTTPAPRSCRRRSSRRSARCRPRWRTDSAIPSPACARPPSSCAAIPRRPPPPSTSTPFSSEVDRLDRRISHLLSFSRPAPFHPMPESLPRLVDEHPAVRRPADPRAPGRAAARDSSRPAQRARRPDADWSRRCSRSSPTPSTRCRRADAPDRGTRRGPRRGRASRSRTRAPAFPRRRSPRSSTRSSPPGRRAPGSGLAIAKRYVEQNGGRLEIESRTGRGDGAFAQRMRRVTRCPPSAERGMSGSTVLIVDDERTLARAVKAFLTESGYEAEVAGDAEQALGMLETLRPGRGLQRRAPARHERHRPAAAHPRVRPRHRRGHHDGPRHHRGRGRGGQARRVRLPQEAGRPRGAQAPRRPRARDTRSSSRSCPTTAAQAARG